MWEEHLHGWLEAATRDKYPGTGPWYRSIDLVQTAFSYSILPMECTYNTFVILPDGDGYFKVIGLVEVICKTILG